MARSRPRGFALAVGLVVGAVNLGATAPAHAFNKGFWGPALVEGRNDFSIYKDLGVSVYQTRLDWDAIAPQRPKRPTDPRDPAYVWPPGVERDIAEARRNGMKVALMIIGAPRWANGDRDSRWAPKRGDDFGKFAEAATRRYPAARYWMVWGEATNALNYQPMDPLTEAGGKGTKITRRQRTAARRYARMVDATYAAIKRVNRADRVVGGMTFSGGDVRTYNWVRNLKLPNGRPPRMDMWGHNPFGFRKPDFKKPQSTFGVVDFSDLPRLARLLDARIRRPDGRPLSLFLSEYTLATGPDAEFNYYVTPKTQADWIKAAMRLSRRWSRIDTFSWIHLFDSPPTSDFRLQSGLLYSDGTRKPGYFAFKNG